MEARLRSTTTPFKAVTVRGRSGGGPVLGSCHAAEGMGRGPSLTGGRRWLAAGGRAGGWRASAQGRGGIGAPKGGTLAQCRLVLKTGSSLFKQI
jgi:hypothetical protein